MDAQTDIQTYLEQGKRALAQGQAREAAIAYAHAAQIEPNNPMVHLGLAEANLALGSYGVVYMACRKVQELQPEGVESDMAKTLLDLLDRRYERALQDIDAVIVKDPGNGYAHALRAYLLRINRQDYDAGLARARAARLSYGGTFENVFPPVDPVYASGYTGASTVPGTAGQNTPNGQVMNGFAPPRTEREPVPTWSRPNTMQRQVVRTRFWMSQNPRFVTNILIAINVVIYLILLVLSATIGQGIGSLGDIDQGVLVNAGAQVNLYVSQGQVWRIFTAMFLHFNLIHIGLNMLSLFLIGVAVEVFFGKWRYLVIYLGSGIVGGIVTYFLLPPDTLAAGASGAIFGVFGALGVFYIMNRQALGRYGTGAIMNWLFWLGLNLVFGFETPGIGIQDHIGGLIAGIILAIILMPRRRLGRS
ncbi:MAG TPA: rhomboid family intramembrane serine protease [Ktedonobacteraceae bacterium]|nr:rhomboid family intramembrane serine protease [Ktedonobacteraceae bacterium]